MIIETNNIPRGVTGTILFAVIACVENEGLSKSGLAAVLNCSTANVTGLVDRATEQGFLISTDKPGDRRTSIVHATDKGRLLIDQVSPEGVQP